MSYVFERLDVHDESWLLKVGGKQAGTIFQAPAWLAFLSITQHGEVVVAALREGRETIGYFAGLIIRKFGLRILGSPFPGWTTDYMGFALSDRADKQRAIKALTDFAFRDLRCVHLEIMDRNLALSDLQGLDVQSRIYRGFEIDLTCDEEKLFSNMSSACRRCIRKAEKEGVRVEEAHDATFVEEYYTQLQSVFAKQSLVPTYGIERVRQLIKHLHPTGNLLLLRALDRDRRCIATGIFLHMNGVMYFWGGASWQRYQILRPNEAIQWTAINMGKKKGAHTYDMGGGGEYKRKYGGYEIEVPWFRKSKYVWIRYMRDLAERIHKARQRHWKLPFVVQRIIT
jgi:CelD/BcsL family acetyltransferase involved in cellulose biosynthesis